MIERHPHPQDKRCNIIRLSEAASLKADDYLQKAKSLKSSLLKHCLKQIGLSSDNCYKLSLITTLNKSIDRKDTMQTNKLQTAPIPKLLATMAMPAIIANLVNSSIIL